MLLNRPRMSPLPWLLAAVLASAGAIALGGPADRTPPPPPDDREVARLIEQLGDPDYFTREQAQEALSRLGFEVFDALTEATTHDDLEVAARARYLLRMMQVEWTREDDPAPVKTLLANYGWLKPEERRERIEKLARLPDAAGVEALCRIVRFEQSGELSKQAALEFLAVYAAGGPPAPEVVDAVRRSLRGIRRPGGQWLLAWAEHHGNLDALASQFARFADEEEASLSKPGPAVNTDVLAALLRFQAAWLEQLDRPDQMVAVMRRLIALEKGGAEDLQKLLHWLIAQKAWPLIDELAARFAGQVQSEPALLYLLAEAQADQGNAGLAEQTAERALALRQGNNRNWLEQRARTGVELWRRNRPQWAEREFRYVLDNGAPADPVTIATRYRFAYMLYDRGEALEAARVLEAVVELFEGNPALADRLETQVEMLRPRMNYYFARHYHKQKDHAKEREHLDKALADDPEELDALIARYRLPGQDDEYRRETLEMIRASAEALRETIASVPDEPMWYNQFAWLVGNTEGDLDEALRCSHKSLELSPNEAAYYDTLAHVYYARNDYANAVKYQSRAVELEPHSKLLSDKLEVFRAALESP